MERKREGATVKRRILALTLLCLLLTMTPASAYADGAWKKNGSGWWYQNEDGSYPAGCIQEIGGKRYYFNASGYMQTGWQKIEGRWYSFDGSGAMRTGWQKVDGSWYYFDASGVMLTGLQTIGSARYWLGSSGAMRTGWQQIGGSWYYFGNSGAMQTGWVKLGGKWYYLDGSGVMQTGWQRIGGSWYSFDASGVMRTGWVKSAGKWYYMGGSGAMQTGWQKIGGKWYYFDGSGVMLSNWQQIRGSWYYLGDDGVMRTGWVKSGGNWYYMGGSGAMQTGWITLGEDTYYAGENGALVVGTTMVIDGKEYRFDHNGVLEDDNLSEAKVYRKMIALKSKYPEGTPWTNSNSYVWDCTVFPDTVYTGFGCVAFAMILSDAAFGDREGRQINTVRLANVRVGDILRINGNSHSVIVLEVHSDSVVIAEGNYNSSVHWGRTLSKQVVESADYLITRYP